MLPHPGVAKQVLVFPICVEESICAESRNINASFYVVFVQI